MWYVFSHFGSGSLLLLGAGHSQPRSSLTKNPATRGGDVWVVGTSQSHALQWVPAFKHCFQAFQTIPRHIVMHEIIYLLTDVTTTCGSCDEVLRPLCRRGNCVSKTCANILNRTEPVTIRFEFGEKTAPRLESLLVEIVGKLTESRTMSCLMIRWSTVWMEIEWTNPGCPLMGFKTLY